MSRKQSQVSKHRSCTIFSSAQRSAQRSWHCKHRPCNDICFFCATGCINNIFYCGRNIAKSGRLEIFVFSAQRSANKNYFLQRSNLAKSGRAGSVPVSYDKCWLWFFFHLLRPTGGYAMSGFTKKYLSARTNADKKICSPNVLKCPLIA